MNLTVDTIPLISQAREHVFPPRHCVSAIVVESQSPSTAISPHGRDDDPLQPTQVIEVGFPSCLMMIRPDQASFDGFDISIVFKSQKQESITTAPFSWLSSTASTPSIVSFKVPSLCLLVPVVILTQTSEASERLKSVRNNYGRSKIIYYNRRKSAYADTYQAGLLRSMLDNRYNYLPCHNILPSITHLSCKV